MLYILHGEDEFTRSVALAKFKAKLGDVTVVSLNTTVLDGRTLNLRSLMQACDALPFMSDRRLVIVENYWSKFEPPKKRKPKEWRPRVSAADKTFIQELVEYLPHIPETTRLVFVEERSLSKTNPAFKALPSDKNLIYVKEFKPPREYDLQRWIEQRMRAKGGTISSQAAHELARFVGHDLRQLDHELEKLLAYADFQRQVTVSDVRKLVSATQTASIFALVDAIGLRRNRQAVHYLHQLLESGAAPLYLLSMIERQFRILLQVKELQARGVTVAQMQRKLGISKAFIIEKSLRQARNFSLARLESIYEHLAEVDQAIKTGQIGDVLALDLLVIELCA